MFHFFVKEFSLDYQIKNLKQKFIFQNINQRIIADILEGFQHLQSV